MSRKLDINRTPQVPEQSREELLARCRKLEKEAAHHNKVQKSKSRTYGDGAVRLSHLDSDARRTHYGYESSNHYVPPHVKSPHYEGKSVNQQGPKPTYSKKSDNMETYGKAKRSRKDSFRPNPAISPDTQTGPPYGARQSRQPQMPPRQGNFPLPSCTIVSGDYSNLPPQSASPLGFLSMPPPGIVRHPYPDLPPQQQIQEPRIVPHKTKLNTENPPGKSFSKAPLSSEYQPYTSHQITTSGARYRADASKDPLGWSKEDMIMAQCHGYSKTALRNLRPNSGSWTLRMLLDNKVSHAPDILDPHLKEFKAAYAAGFIDEPIGFLPDHLLIAKRATNVTNQGTKPVNNSADKSRVRDRETTGSSKRSASMSSEKSSNPNERERKPEPKYSYCHSNTDLIDNSNKRSDKIDMIKARKACMASKWSGTVVQNETPSVLYSATHNHSCSRIKAYSANPKGDLSRTMVYCNYLEDAALRPIEQSVYCNQCNAIHPVHTQEPIVIFVVTEDQELANGTKSHLGSWDDKSFRNVLVREGIDHSDIIHIVFVDVRDGGAYANNQFWLSALLNSECKCRGFIFWNVGTSFLINGGSASDLLKINKETEKFVVEMPVKIRGKPVNLGHKFILVPLIYNKVTRDRDLKATELSGNAGINLVPGQSFFQFLDYNNLVRLDLEKSYPASHSELHDPNMLLAVKICTYTSKVYERNYNTTRHVMRDGNNPNDNLMMNDGDTMTYLVNLIKWVKKNYEGETLAEMLKAKVPKKKSSLRPPDRF